MIARAAIVIAIAICTARAHAQEPAPAPEHEEPEEPEAREAPEAPPPTFRARARVVRTTAGTRRFEEREVRDVPGTFGDPFRTVESLPGVVPVASGVPQFYVRGAPPAGTLYVYDGIPVPVLFHLGLGPAVVHPRMLGAMRLHAGGAPARYGRMVGAVIAAEGPRRGPLLRAAGEVELRALDVNGYFEVPIDGGGDVRGAIRWGWPALLAGVIFAGTELFFGDYQLRASLPISPLDRVEVVALGAYDRLTIPVAGLRSETEIQFHRVEARLLHAVGALELGAALRAGYDRSSIHGAGTASDPLNALTIDIEAGSLTPRLWASWREPGYRLAGGAELIATFGRPDAALRTLPGLPLRADDVFTESTTRSTTSAWVELGIDPLPEITIELGARTDLWVTGGAVEGAVDPRLRVIARPIPELELHAAGGVARQPAAFYLPVPGLSDVSLTRGLQTAVQGEAGARIAIAPVEGELTFFVHHYDGLVFTDAFLLNQAAASICARPGGGCIDVQAEARTSGLSWGGELLLRLSPDLPISGWLSYTLAWVELAPVLGLPYRAPFDVRHVLSIVARWEIVPGLTLGARVFLRSGVPQGMFWVSERDRTLYRHTQELDPFFRADASLAYAWDAGWARLRVSLEWLNVTIAAESFGIDCPMAGPPPDGRCPVTPGVPIFAPNLGIRAEL